MTLEDDTNVFSFTNSPHKNSSVTTKSCPCPDLKPTENMCGELKKRIYNTGARTLKDLERFCTKASSQSSCFLISKHYRRTLTCCYVGKRRLHKVLNVGVTSGFVTQRHYLNPFLSIFTKG